MAEPEARAFLTSLATERDVSASTQNQALSALVFLYAQVLRTPLPRIEEVPRACVPGKLPTVLSREEAARVLGAMEGVTKIVALLLYGSGLRLLECLELRVKDLDFGRSQILLRRGKGQKDRVTMMPAVARRPLEEHLSIVRARHEADLAKGFGRVVLPFALERKFPNAASEWGWQFVFPAARICRNPKWGAPTRFHLHESVVQRAVTETARRVGLTKRVSCHTRSESRRGGSRDAEGAETRRSSVRYTHVVNRGALGVRSPADRL